jgi:hypothetical protein
MKTVLVLITWFILPFFKLDIHLAYRHQTVCTGVGHRYLLLAMLTYCSVYFVDDVACSTNPFALTLSSLVVSACTAN